MKRSMLGVAALFAAHPLAAQLSQPKSERLPNGAIRVINEGPSAWAPGKGWTIALETTIQPLEGAPGELEKPWGVLRASDGRLIVWDFQTPSIRLYDKNGRYLRELGRKGEGPGEYRSPAATLLHDTLVIHDGRINRVTMMTLDGKSVRSFPIPTTNTSARPMIDAMNRLVVPAYGGASRSLYRRYTVTGALVDSVGYPQVSTGREWTFSSGGGTAGYQIPFTAFTGRAILHDGTVLYGNTGEYQLRITRTGHDTVRLIERRGVTPVPVNPAMRDSIFKSYVDRVPGLRAVASLKDIPTNQPFWVAAFEDGAANIWVLLGDSPGTPERFDVFNHDGRYLGGIATPFINGRGQYPFFMGDRIGVINTDENDLPRVRVYRIVMK